MYIYTYMYTYTLNYNFHISSNFIFNSLVQFCFHGSAVVGLSTYTAGFFWPGFFCIYHNLAIIGNRLGPSPYSGGGTGGRIVRLAIRHISIMRNIGIY